MSEYLRELWEHRSDGYFWADHQLELAVLVALAAGTIGLVFTYAELALKRSMLPKAPDG